MRTEEIRTHSKLISVIPSQSSLRKAASVCSHSAHATPGIAPHAAERKAATRDAHATWHGVLSHMGAAQAVRSAHVRERPCERACVYLSHMGAAQAVRQHGVLSHMGAAQAVRLAEGSPQPSRPAARPPGSDAQ